MSDFVLSPVPQDLDSMAALLARLNKVQTGWISFLPSAARTSAAVSTAIDCRGYSKMLVRITITAITAGSGLYCILLDEASGDYLGTADRSEFASVFGKHYWIFGSGLGEPGITDQVASIGSTQTIHAPILNKVKIYIIPQNFDPNTYSVDYQLLP